MSISRRNFFKITGLGAAAAATAPLGFPAFAASCW
jgi:anaerobic selenocysteine-containing dehydrogenase